MNQRPSKRFDFNVNLKIGIWFIGIASWLFGITDRSMALLSDGYLTVTDLLQLSMAAFFFVSWLCLKPSSSLSSQQRETQ